MDIEMHRRRWARGVGWFGLAMTMLTASWPAWIEPMFGDGGDRGNGTIEYCIAAGLLIASLALRWWGRVVTYVDTDSSPSGQPAT